MDNKVDDYVKLLYPNLLILHEKVDYLPTVYLFLFDKELKKFHFLFPHLLSRFPISNLTTSSKSVILVLCQDLVQVKMRFSSA